VTIETRTRLLQRAVHLLGIAMLAWIAPAVVDPLAVNPIQALILRSGTAASLLLIATLAITPLSTVAAKRWLPAWRKPLGLYAFAAALIHMLCFSVVDFGGDLALIAAEIATKPYILAGSAALLLLLPLAVTSTRGWQQRLGKNWKPLHRLIYPAMLLVIVHDVWQSKDPRAAYVAGGVVLILLLLRLPPLRRRLAALRPR
jgi:methionine sulfoxide reductase heme-binding subunit